MSTQRLNINQFSRGWRNFIDGALCDRQISARELSRLVGCNEGTICLARTKGHIPRRPMVEKIGRVLGEEATLRAAGYLSLTGAHG